MKKFENIFGKNKTFQINMTVCFNFVYFKYHAYICISMAHLLKHNTLLNTYHLSGVYIIQLELEVVTKTLCNFGGYRKNEDGKPQKLSTYSK